MTDSSRYPRSANLSCPICDEPITVTITWETERGEFGTILARWPEMDPDPHTIDKHGECHCDFSSSLAEALADYLNDNDRLQQILFPPPEDLEKTYSLSQSQIEDLSAEELALLRKLVEAGGEGLRIGDLLGRPER